MIGKNSMEPAKFNYLKKKEKDFYSHLNMEDVIDADYAHPKRVCKDFKKFVKDCKKFRIIL